MKTRYYFALTALVCFCVLMFTGCDSKDEVAERPADGIEFSPISDYQEAYPGAIINFQYRVRSAEPVTSFKVQFKLPGSSDFTDMPEYPEVIQDPSFTSVFNDFEFSLPPSEIAVDTEAKFKFIAKTATQTFERVYTVKILNIGLQVLRLYNPIASGYYKAPALDLLKGMIVPSTSAFGEDTKDMKAVTVLANIGDKGEPFSILLGWTSGNTTRFKLKDKTTFDRDPSTYAAAYAATNPAEVTGARMGAPTSPLLANRYYLAKIARPGGTPRYVGILIKRLPTSGYFTTTRRQDLSGEFLEIQIKK